MFIFLKNIFKNIQQKNGKKTTKLSKLKKELEIKYYVFTEQNNIDNIFNSIPRDILTRVVIPYLTIKDGISFCLTNKNFFNNRSVFIKSNFVMDSNIFNLLAECHHMHVSESQKNTAKSIMFTGTCIFGMTLTGILTYYCFLSMTLPRKILKDLHDHCSSGRSDHYNCKYFLDNFKYPKFCLEDKGFSVWKQYLDLTDKIEQGCIQWNIDHNIWLLNFLAIIVLFLVAYLYSEFQLHSPEVISDLPLNKKKLNKVRNIYNSSISQDEKLNNHQFLDVNIVQIKSKLRILMWKNQAVNTQNKQEVKQKNRSCCLIL